MSEPYARVGRGGAGNYYNKEDLKEVQVYLHFSLLYSAKLSFHPSSYTTLNVRNNTLQTPSTLESQPQSSASPQTQTPSAPPSEYLHTGRGGAGNWIQPSTLPLPVTDPNSTSLSSPPTIPDRNSSIPTHKPSAENEKAVYRGGRGGAGNYSWGVDDGAAEEKRRQEEDERIREEKIKQMVKGEVEGGLMAPPKALAGKGGGRDRVGI
jgi:hypothetical protein